jgi:GT2 family glycosyltransferase
MLSEFGLDSRRNGADAQARLLRHAIRAARDAGLAAITVYAWTDRWWNAGAEVSDWDFGLTDRTGAPSPPCRRSAGNSPTTTTPTTPNQPPPPSPPPPTPPRRPGPRLLGDRLHLQRRTADQPLPGRGPTARTPGFETIVVDDGSADGTAGLVAHRFPGVRLVRTARSGLERGPQRRRRRRARRDPRVHRRRLPAGPRVLARLEEAFGDGRWDAVGGPNLPPPPASCAEAVVAAAPGAPSHVMLDDAEAEHIPGCNLAVRREAFERIGGFDPRFRTAGDDVDFCWRLRDAGMRVGFCPTAFVWHARRPDAPGYLAQQAGYGRAEALLADKFPHRCRHGGARWLGQIYQGGPIRAGRDAVIYHGTLGTAGYRRWSTACCPAARSPTASTARSPGSACACWNGSARSPATPPAAGSAAPGHRAGRATARRPRRPPPAAIGNSHSGRPPATPAPGCCAPCWPPAGRPPATTRRGT